MPDKQKNPLTNDAAVNLAREVLAEVEDGGIGRYLGVDELDGYVATHRFRATVPGYPGWEWHAVLARAAGSKDVTVNEVALVPGARALQAPEWVPYSQRVRPGDMGPGDLMPPAADDVRLDAERNLTPAALESAKNRWRTGEHGPNTGMAAAAPLQCRTCAFLLPLAAAVGKNYGVCANEYSADGVVVHAGYGCGAHSGIKVSGEEKAPAVPFDDEKPLY